MGQPLNYSIGREYSLSVTVCDGSPSSPDTLNDTTLVFVALIRTNRYSPEFLDGPTLQAHVTEGKPFDEFLQVSDLKHLCSKLHHYDLLNSNCL